MLEQQLNSSFTKENSDRGTQKNIRHTQQIMLDTQETHPAHFSSDTQRHSNTDAGVQQGLPSAQRSNTQHSANSTQHSAQQKSSRSESPNDPTSNSKNPPLPHIPLVQPLRQNQFVSYSLKPNVVPNFVVAKMASAHYNQSNNNSNVNNDQSSTESLVRAVSTQSLEHQYASFLNDPFIETVGNFANLLNTVKQPTEFPSDRLSLHESFSDYPDYDIPWGGDERLRQTLVGSGSGENSSENEKKQGFWSGLFSKRKTSPDENPRHRSKAGYWMLDEKRKNLYPTLHRIFVQNPLVPLLLRILILVFSVCSLALATSIYTHLVVPIRNTLIGQQPSTIFAIVVQSLAIVYIVYIGYDEYSGKPLGLRDPLGKMKLIMLDLLFIICSSANLSLAFDALYDSEWVCLSKLSPSSEVLTITVGFLCRRQKALAAFLILVLCLWVLTFTISMIRVVDRVSTVPRQE